MKIADMGTTNPEILNEIEDIVERKFSSLVIHDFSKAGGVESLAGILNHCDRATEKNIMEWLEIENQDIATQVRELMFVFEDIIQLDDSSIQRVLREVDSRDLATSLKGSKEEVKQKILKNMSERAQSVLLEDIEYMGPVRTKEVQKAQSKIVGVIKALEAVGEVTIYRGGQEDELIE
jgi:flagellar motor switch protein FliG